ncbi:unnamed protein product, partial [Urochloa humidicola]
IKRCSLGDDANKAIYNLRAEMKDHKHTLGSKMSDLEKKLSSELALVKQSFESHKKFTEKEIIEAQLTWARYHLVGAIAVFTMVLFSGH